VDTELEHAARAHSLQQRRQPGSAVIARGRHRIRKDRRGRRQHLPPNRKARLAPLKRRHNR
jgi:hypothetical protein